MNLVKVNVKGRVQGVGFRYFVKDIAEFYKLNGYVKNLEDKSVEIVVDFNEIDCKIQNEFISKIKIGPAFSIVTEIEIMEIENHNQIEKGFLILR